MTDASGRRVATLVNGRQAAGRHSARWDASAVAPGVYFCTIRTAGRTLTRQFVVGR